MNAKLQTLKDLEVELKRFKHKLSAAITEQYNANDSQYQFREYAALKRSAMDLKRELTKVTDSARSK